MPPITSPGRAAYLSRLLAAQAELYRPGTVTVATLAHEPDCPRLTGGDCTCQPDITTAADGKYHDIDRTGTPSTTRSKQ